MTVALLSSAILPITPSRRPRAVASEALRGVSSQRLAGRLRASGLFGRIAEQAALGLFQSAACGASGEFAVQAAHASIPSVLTVRGNRASLAGIVATSADLPNPAAREA